MDLEEKIKDISCNMDSLSIKDTVDKILIKNKHENLYQFFFDDTGQYHHTLVKDDEEQVKEEFYLLLCDSDEDSEVNRESYTVFYEFDYEIKDNLLTIFICFTDYYTQSEVRIPFIYNLEDEMMLCELYQLLNHDKADFFFLQLVNNTLINKHRMECFVSEAFKNNLESAINRFLDDRPVVFIDDVLNKIKDREDKGETEYQKYNWVDVKGFAEDVFYNYGFEIAWAEDAWNILMFNSVVDSTNIVGSNQSDYEKGDIVLWLAALYDLYYEYKVAADYESSDGPTPIENVDRINNVEKYISVFLKGDIFEELNEQLSEGKCNQSEFYNVGRDTFLFTGYYDEPSIAYQAYYNEIKRRREIIQGIFYSHFKGNTILISEFMEGTHWSENYLNVNKKRQDIEDKYEKILICVNEGKIVKYNIGNSEYEYTDEDEVCKDLEYELEEFENEIREYKSDAQTGRVYQWISNGMSF